jgi:hypothetical protein
VILIGLYGCSYEFLGGQQAGWRIAAAAAAQQQHAPARRCCYGGLVLASYCIQLYCTVLYCTVQLYWHAAAMLLAGIMPAGPPAAAACSMHGSLHGAWQRLAAGGSWPGRVKQPETVTLEVYCVITLSVTPPTCVV